METVRTVGELKALLAEIPDDEQVDVYKGEVRVLSIIGLGEFNMDHAEWDVPYGWTRSGELKKMP